MFINETGTIGLILAAGTETVTGSLFATLLLVMIFLIVICIMFGIPIEYISIIILPYCIACGAYYQNFITPLGIILIYLTTIITKNWIFR